ncbi:MAG: SAM-dependent methyltransferase, partial [Candidatus Ranarchaeia archaeon]
MPKKRGWIQKRLRDPYYQLAKKQGYMSRAAFKLHAIQRKFNIFHAGQKVIDLCCAPGGWVQVIAEYVGEKGTVIGIDLVRTRAIGKAILIKADITKEDVFEKLENTRIGKVDVIVSDCSSKTSGISKLDNARQMHLVECTFKIADKLLKKGGSVVSKLFQGSDTQGFVRIIKKSFKHVFLMKPSASSSKSKEIYLIAKGYQKGETPKIKKKGFSYRDL